MNTPKPGSMLEIEFHKRMKSVVPKGQQRYIMEAFRDALRTVAANLIDPTAEVTLTGRTITAKMAGEAIQRQIIEDGAVVLRRPGLPAFHDEVRRVLVGDGGKHSDSWTIAKYLFTQPRIAVNITGSDFNQEEDNPHLGGAAIELLPTTLLRMAAGLES